MLRQDVVCSLLLFSAVGFLDVYTLPLDFKPTKRELQPVDLGSVLQSEQFPCFAGRSYLSIVSKRQEAAGCIGEYCGLNADAVSEPPAIDNQPIKWNYPSGNQEEPLEFAVNLNSGSENNAFSNGNEYWNNAIPNPPFNDATKEMLPSASIGYLDLGEAKIPDDKPDGTLDDHLEAAKPKKDPSPTVDQDSLTGEPIENSCLAPPQGQRNAYLVHLVEVKTPVAHRNPQGILVSQYTSPVRNYYDVIPGPTQFIKYRKRVNFVFLSGRKVIQLRRYEPRGWLVSLPEEPVEAALEWFENLAQDVAPTRPTPMSSIPPNYTAVWVNEVFAALKNSQSRYWVPI